MLAPRAPTAQSQGSPQSSEMPIAPMVAATNVKGLTHRRSRDRRLALAHDLALRIQHPDLQAVGLEGLAEGQDHLRRRRPKLAPTAGHTEISCASALAGLAASIASATISHSRNWWADASAPPMPSSPPVPGIGIRAASGPDQGEPDQEPERHKERRDQPRPAIIAPGGFSARRGRRGARRLRRGRGRRRA